MYDNLFKIIKCGKFYGKNIAHAQPVWSNNAADLIFMYMYMY